MLEITISTNSINQKCLFSFLKKSHFGFVVFFFFKPIHSQIGTIYIYLLLLDWIYNVGDRQRQKKSGSNLLLAPYPILR